VKFFRDAARIDLPMSMAGIKLGDRVIVVGCGDARLVAAVALKAGLTGTACAIDESETRSQHAAAVALREGALVDTITAPWTSMPVDSESFDVAVVRDILAQLPPDRRPGCLAEVRRALRPGGRCLVIEPSARSGLGALIGRHRVDPSYTAAGGALQALMAQGFHAVRTLAEREGLLFVEGVRANT
jgi:ubiquinone/menaquinone biosynthesis C-methylase UbiE